MKSHGNRQSALSGALATDGQQTLSDGNREVPSQAARTDTGKVPPEKGSLTEISQRRWVRFTLVLFAAFWIAVIAVSWAEAEADASEAPPDSVSDNSRDEYSFKWLDPDKRIYVLQNRRYLKANRAMVSVLAGPGFSNSYRNTAGVSPRLAYYFSEAFGLEAFYTAGLNSENSTFAALKVSSPNALPVVREIRSQLGVNFLYVPWYAKINVFNKILYFDWYFSAGAGVLQAALDTRTNSSAAPVYQDQSYGAGYLGTGHLFHLSQLVTFRLDVSTAIYKAPINGISGEESYYTNYLFGVGLGLRL